ncbi:MAG: DUF29 domain-containing protein [Elainella sp.]
MTAQPMPHQNLYETDFYAWTQTQAKLLQAGRWQELDVVNLVEEIESLGKQQRQELRNRLGVLLGHLLKWELQPDHRSKSWFFTIREQRRELADLLQDSPSLGPYLPEAVERAYLAGIDLVLRETPLRYRDLPPDCSYSLEQILDDGFLPGESIDWDEWQ